jgi:hypothetical protein
MVKAPIVSRVGDHKRQDLHIRPANRHYVASGGPCVSPQQSTHIGRSAVRRGIGLSRCGTLTMPLPNPHERIARSIVIWSTSSGGSSGDVSSSTGSASSASSASSGGSTGSNGGPRAPVPAPPMVLLFGAAAAALVARKRFAEPKGVAA